MKYIIFILCCVVFIVAKDSKKEVENTKADKEKFFIEKVKPILEESCISCHAKPYKDSRGRTKKPKGGVQLSDLEHVLELIDDRPLLTPNNAAESLLFKSITLDADDDDIMPPEKKGGKMSDDKIAIIKQWINDGAHWPEGVEILREEKKK